MDRKNAHNAKRHAANLEVGYVKGAARIEAAHQLHPWLAAPDYSAPLLIEGAGIMGDRIADAPSFAGVYTITATMQGEPLTLYAGETVCIWERIEAHFPNEEEEHFSEPLHHRLVELEDATGQLFEGVTLSAWRIEGDRYQRRERERDALDALGAVFEYKDRRAATCLPAPLLDALKLHRRLAIKRGASAQLAKAQGRT